ncbi:Dabb family protein [Gordonia otitidis]|uniref:Dabb family protein n=1 Tax=Gordonia otitidis TaxID=249058 RepID=UPI001D149C76|nr:Dabb family protein [Gordonia otitidis]UEA57994.1 Dabb family protein [Gordonia otitidis]
MIRNVVMGRLRPADGEAALRDRRQLDEGLAGIAALRLPGLLSNRIGLDLGLREGGWSFAITNDWVDADAYRTYDLDPEHYRFRAMVVEVCEQVARVQFEA